MPISYQAKTAYITAALLLELENLRESIPTKSYDEDMERLEKYTRRLHEKMMSQVPKHHQYLVNKAAELSIKAARMSFDKIESILSKDLERVKS